jgi:hypothetical protein
MNSVSADVVAQEQSPSTAESRSKRRERRADALCAIALCLLTLLTWIPRWSGPIDLRWDAGTYFILGTSLAQGKGYRLLNEPGEIRADQYPPLQAAIVAIHEKLLSSSDPVKVGIWLRRTWILLSVAYACGSFFLARLFLSRLYSFGLAAICTINYDMYFLATLCFAELPFALATVLFAWSYLRKGGESWTRHISPVFAIAAYLLRTMGVALLLAWIADAVLRRRFRAAGIRAVVALAPVIAWQSYVHSVESSPEYKRPYYAYQRDPSMFYNVSYAENMKLKDPFKPDLGNVTVRDLVSRFFHNAIWMPRDLGQSVAAREPYLEGHVKFLNRVLRRPAARPRVHKIVLYVLGSLVLLGTLQLLLERQWLISLTVLLTLAAVCTTPWPSQFGRYLAPILPLLLLALMSALRGFSNTGRRLFLVVPASARAFRVLRIATTAFVFCECCAALKSGNTNFLLKAYYRDAKGQKQPYRLVYYSAEYPDRQDALDWLSKRADPHSVLAVTMPQWVYLQSGFKTVMIPLTFDGAKAERLMDTVPVSFVFVEPGLRDDNFNTYLPKMVANSADHWKLVYSKEPSIVKLYARVGVARLSGKIVTK